MCDLLHLAEVFNDVPICAQEEQRELAKTIRVSGSILLSTVSNFLDFFKMEAGKQLDVVRTEITTKVVLGLLPASDSPLLFLLIKQKKRFFDDACIASCLTVLISCRPWWSLMSPADLSVNIYFSPRECQPEPGKHR